MQEEHAGVTSRRRREAWDVLPENVASEIARILRRLSSFEGALPRGVTFSTDEALGLFEGLFDPEGVLGAVWLPTDGWLNPSDLTMAFAAGARGMGVEIATSTRVTGIGVSAPDTSATGLALSSNSFTLTAGSTASVITSCSGCHTFPPADSTGNRNVPVGSIVGSHSEHSAAACSTCHVVPATETGVDFGHRSGTVQFVAGVGYTEWRDLTIETTMDSANGNGVSMRATGPAFQKNEPRISGP